MKTKLKSLLLVLAVVPFFISCNKEEPSAGDPTITFDQEGVVDVTYGELTVSGTITSKEGTTIESATITCLYTEGEEAKEAEIGTLEDMLSVESKSSHYTFSINQDTESIADYIATITGIKIKAKVAGGGEQEASITLEVTDPKFEWVREGSSNATGMTNFGLQLRIKDDNVEVYSTKESDSNFRFVKFKSAAWDDTTISYQDLTNNIITSTSIASDAIAMSEVELDIVYGIKASNTDYMLLHLTKMEVTPIGNNAYKIVITGKYRDKKSFN